MISEKQNLIFALEAENDGLKREISRVLKSKGQVSEDKIGKYSNAEVKEIIENCAEMEKELKRKKEELQSVVNQNLYLMENNQNLATELKTTKLQLLSAKRSQFVTSRTKSEIDLKLETEKNESYKKKLKILKNQLKDQSEENSLKLSQLSEEKSHLKEELKQTNILLQKSKENENLTAEKLKYLEKEQASLREVANSYKKKFEEISVENGLLVERITYKDEKIKRDSDSIKSLKKTEADFITLKRNYQELEDLYQQSQIKTDKILKNVIQQKEKWLKKEDSYKSLLVKSGNDKNFDLNEIFRFDLEICELKKEIEDCKIVEKGYVDRIQGLENSLRNVEVFWDRIENLLKCCACEVSGGGLVVVVPCYHVLCNKCYGGQCKQCYCNISNSVHLELADNIMKLISIYRVKRTEN